MLETGDDTVGEVEGGRPANLTLLLWKMFLGNVALSPWQTLCLEQGGRGAPRGRQFGTRGLLALQGGQWDLKEEQEQGRGEVKEEEAGKRGQLEQEAEEELEELWEVTVEQAQPPASLAQSSCPLALVSRFSRLLRMVLLLLCQ